MTSLLYNGFTINRLPRIFSVPGTDQPFMKILYVEDEIAHVELTQRTLEDNLADEFVLYHRDNLKDAFELLKTEPDIDLVLTDLRLPDGSGLELLEMVKELPFHPAVVLVTGQGDQEIAVKALKAGAADYLVKQSDYLHRLPVVISNAVAQNRLEHEQAAKREAEGKYQSLIEQTPAVVFLDGVDVKNTTIYISPRIFELTGYTPEEWCADPLLWENSIHPQDRSRISESERRTHKAGERFQEEYRLIRRDGQMVWVKEDTTLIHDKNGKPLYWQGILYDITKGKENEAALQRQLNELSVLQSAAVAGTESFSESEIIEKVTGIVGRIYPEVCGILILNEDGTMLTPHPSYIGADAPDWRQSYSTNTGITGRAASLGKIIRVGDVTKDPAFIEIASGVKSELCAPIRVSRRIIGVINIESREYNAFSENDERLLDTIASGLGTALERLRLFHAEQQRSRELETLYQTTKLLTQSLESQTVAENLITILEQLLGYEYCSVGMLDESNQQLIPLALSRKGKDQETYKKELQSLIDQKFSPGVGISGWVIQNGMAVRSGDVTKDPRYIGVIEGINSEICVPLVSRGRAIGVLNIETSQPDAYTEKDEDLLTALASSAAIAFENARLFQEQNQRSKIIEALAGIANEMATTREILPVLEKITQRTLTLLQAKRVAIYMIQDDNRTIKAVSAQGMQREQILSNSIKLGEGITGKVIANGRPEIINDMASDLRRKPVPGTPETDSQIETLMSSPLVLRGRVIGAINAWRLKEDGLFNKTELNFLVSIADQASICIESGRLFQETSRRAQEAAAIAEVGRGISSTLELNAVLERIAFYAKDLLHAETSAVYLASQGSPTLSAIAAIGFDSEEIKNDPLTIGEGILGNIALQKSGAFVNDTASDPRMIIVKGTIQNPHEHVMGIPILFGNQLTGLLAVWRTGQGQEFRLAELDFASQLAQQAAFALENSRLFNETQRRLKELEIVNRVSTSLRLAQSLDEMLPILLHETLELVDTQHGSIWLYDHSSGTLAQKITSGTEKQFKHTSLMPNQGIIGHVFTTAIRYVSPEIKNDPMLLDGNRDSISPGVGGCYIPIQSTAGPVGVLVALIESGRQISDELNLLSILAEITGNAIHRSQLYEQSQRQVRRLTTLRDIDAAIASSFDLRLTLNILIDQTISHLNVDAVDIALYHPDIQSISYLIGSGFRTTSPTRPQIRIGEGLAGQVVMQQQTYHVTDLQSAPETRNDILIKREGFVAYIGIPLIVKGQIKGVFEVFQRSAISPTPDWMDFLHTLAGQAAIAIDNSHLFENLQRSNQELMQAYDTTLEGWARALELRDQETEGHTRRVTKLTLQLAKYMGIKDSELVNIRRGVLLHDIGKMGVPDNILKKTGPLSEAEWGEMRQHPVYAYKLLSPIEYLRDAIEIPYCHHEHWDGSGYPRGLKGTQIPLSARIFSIIDIWDALLSDRSYRKAWERDKVISYLKEIAGKHIDPDILEIFLRMIEETEIETG